MKVRGEGNKIYKIQLPLLLTSSFSPSFMERGQKEVISSGSCHWLTCLTFNSAQ